MLFYRRPSSLSNGKVTVSKAQDIAAAKEGTTLINKEESAVGSVGIGVYTRYFGSIGLMYTTLSIVCGIAQQGFQVYSNTWLSEWAGHPDANEPEVRDLYLGVYGAIGIAQGMQFKFSLNIIF